MKNFINKFVNLDDNKFPVPEQSWMTEFATLHQKLIAFNSEVEYIKTNTNSHQLNTQNLRYFTKLGEILPKKSVNTELSVWPITFYFGCVIFQLGASTIFHWFNPINRTLYKVLHRLDISAITILIFGSVFSVIYYAFYCDLEGWYLWICLNGFACIGTFIISMFDWFHDEKMVKIKGIIYGSCGIFAGAVFTDIGIQSHMYGSDLNSDTVRV